MCQRVERSNDDPLRSLWMWERTKALNVLPNGLSSYKLMRREHFGSFWVERGWVRETEAEKEHRFQAIQTSALLVNDSRSVTDNVNITKIQLCCRTLDFWNKTQNRNECVFCCNNWFEVHAPSAINPSDHLIQPWSLLSLVSDSSFFCVGDSHFDLGTMWSSWQMSLWWLQGIFCSHQRSSWTFWDLLPGKVFHLLRFKQWLSACFPAFQGSQAQKKPSLKWWAAAL